MDHAEPIAGFYAPVHRALTEPILLGGAPRAVAIVNGTLAAAVGLGTAALDRRRARSGWSAISPRSGPPSAIPAFVDVVRRHLRYPQHLVA